MSFAFEGTFYYVIKPTGFYFMAAFHHIKYCLSVLVYLDFDAQEDEKFVFRTVFHVRNGICCPKGNGGTNP